MEYHHQHCLGPLLRSVLRVIGKPFSLETCSCACSDCQCVP
ncbi:hypothetical protein ERJ98_02935 [Bifidobacterium longum subsp. longum]|nr:hypothetical protein [Bifidobacterium longum subsp. longum]